jgi:hypothetical protein
MFANGRILFERWLDLVVEPDARQTASRDDFRVERREGGKGARADR